MKEILSSLIVCSLSVVLGSWGCRGHETIALIAERHLTNNAKAAVKYYLKGQSLSEASMWADEVRINPNFSKIGAWHYISLPPGLSFDEFKKEVTSQSRNNVYKALVICQRDLSDSTLPKDKRAQALKFIIHFIGDVHQPMHVSQAGDRNGNKIKINFKGRETDLHGLWDNFLLMNSGLNAKQLAKQWDRATPDQLTKWQTDSLIKWVWESYQASTQLYKETGSKKRIIVDDKYYQQHLPMLEETISKAGIRLAGLLNEEFKTFRLPENK